jgi:hypothetical protein
MNNNDSNALVAESEIRAALSFLRIDRDAFGHGVRERIKQASVRPTGTESVKFEDHGGLLRIAASVMPVNLLGAKTTVSQSPFAATGFFQKAIACLALPTVSFMMIVVTVFSWYRIRVAQQSESLPEADMERIEGTVNAWWRQYGWVAGIVFALALAAPFLGWTTPLLLLLVASAIGAASIITTLGKAGLVDRDVIGGFCIAMLGLLGQVSVGAAMASDAQLLDPHLVTFTFFAGAAALILFVNPVALLSGLKAKPVKNKQILIQATVGFAGLLALVLLGFITPTPFVVAVIGVFALALSIAAYVRHKLLNSNVGPTTGIVTRCVLFTLVAGVAAFFGQTLWRPIGKATLVQYAKDFDPELVGYWSHWQATDRWLQDQGIDYDHSAVQARWTEALNENDSNRIYLLNNAVATGLTFPPNLIETKEFKATSQLLLSPRSAGTAISSIDQRQYVIAILAKEGKLTAEQRDHLAERLLATWRSLNDGAIRESIVTATTITDMLELIDRPLAREERKADVDRWLGQYQYIASRAFVRSGGFKRYSTMDSGDLMATDHAVRLMQHYETHESVDVLALRAYLRPASSDRQLMKTASLRASVRQRLDQVPDISRPSLWDYLRLNQSLWFAMLLVGTSIYATLGSPKILREANDPQ